MYIPSELRALLENPGKLCIVNHLNPDGDAMGSAMSLNHMLGLLGHEVATIVPNAYPKVFEELANLGRVINFELDESHAKSFLEESRLIFTLDFNTPDRCGEVLGSLILAQASPKVMIDHHQQPGAYAAYTFSDTSKSSTCEMVWDFIEAMNWQHKANQAVADALYVGLMTDTGSFRFPSVLPNTHLTAAKLLEKGARNAYWHEKVMDSNRVQRLQLLGNFLQNMAIYPEYRTVFFHLPHHTLNECRYEKGDTEGFVNYGLSLEGMGLSVFFLEKGPNYWKLSFRSKGDRDVNALARALFSGGGHKNAAGGEWQGTLPEAQQLLLNHLKQEAWQ